MSIKLHVTIESLQQHLKIDEGCINLIDRTKKKTNFELSIHPHSKVIDNYLICIDSKLVPMKMDSNYLEVGFEQYRC